MKFLVVLSALLLAAETAPGKLLTPRLLQDLAYRSLDLDMDGKPDEAIAVSHSAPYVHTAPVAPVAYHAPVASEFHYAPSNVFYAHNGHFLKHAFSAPVAPVAPFYTIRAPWYKHW